MNSPCPKYQRGAALTELAILLPVLLTMVFGIAEISRSLLLEHVLIRHVETAARFLGRSYQTVNSDCSTNAGWPAAVSTAATLAVYGNEAGNGNPLIGGMSTAQVGISVAPGSIPGYGSACVIQVQASVPYPSIFGATIPLLGLAQPTLQAASEERYVGE